jgi:hypothetical protein
MPLAFIHFLEGGHRPVDPGYGVDEGGNVDNTLPVPNPPPGQPGHLPSVPINWPIIPSHPIARPPRPSRPVDPGYGVGSEHPDQGPVPNPPPGQPGHLPSVPPGWPVIPSHPIAGLWPGRPSHGLPGGGGGGIPDNTLPPVPPPTLMPGWTLLLVRGPDGTWKYASLAPSSPPPRPLPEPIPPGGAPDQGLPPQPTPPPVAGTPPVTPAPSPTR